MDLSSVMGEHLADPHSSWSCGAFGALAEFARAPEEPCELRTGDTFSAVTGRGALRIDMISEIRPVVYKVGVALCLPLDASSMGRRSVFTELGSDVDAIRPEDRSMVMFDVGLDLLQADVCIRVADSGAIQSLRSYAGSSFFDPQNSLAQLILRLQPQRVVQCRFGRIEVYGPIPRTGETSPEGPHTHVLPKLLARRRTHAANIPIPADYVPCMTLYPSTISPAAAYRSNVRATR
jgi:hypothetical protein